MKKSIWLLAALSTWAATPTRAALIVDFGQSSYTAAPGSTVNIPVFLRQTGTDTILTTEGLFTGGLLVSFNLPPRTANPAQVTTIVANPAFNFLAPLVIVPASAGATGSVNLEVADFTAAGAVFPTMNQILLGTITFQTSLVAGTTLINAADLEPATGFDNFVTGQGTVLDGRLTFGTTSISTGAIPIPEPAAVLLMAIGTVGIILGRALRRRP